ncbi:hypothetical protein [Gibbsiella quercinecans]|uniref:hypothetical protein n=1 Tax=Gibbsiella quercinecans TaxID=929813 RepID=UPI00242F32A2|nr:hypothetical protein [Gibbsiella quercinecans]
MNAKILILALVAAFAVINSGLERDNIAKESSRINYECSYYKYGAKKTDVVSVTDFDVRVNGVDFPMVKGGAKLTGGEFFMYSGTEIMTTTQNMKPVIMNEELHGITNYNCEMKK